MVRHISLFRLKPECRTPEVMGLLQNLLEALPGREPSILSSEVGCRPLDTPVASPDGMVQFYDVVQIITFASPAECANYPATPGHRDLLEATNPYMDAVVGIDYPVEA